MEQDDIHETELCEYMRGDASVGKKLNLCQS